MLKHQPLDLVFQALADPTRRQLVETLSRGSASVSQLAKPLPMSLPAVFQHLRVLEASGLVRSEKIGRVRTCRLDMAMLQDADTWFEAQRTVWESRLNRLDAYLASLPPETSANPSPKGKNS